MRQIPKNANFIINSESVVFGVQKHTTDTFCDFLMHAAHFIIAQSHINHPSIQTHHNKEKVTFITTFA